MNDIPLIKKSWYDTDAGPLLTQTEVLARGFTKAELRALGEPDFLGINPAGGARVRLFNLERIQNAETHKKYSGKERDDKTLAVFRAHCLDRVLKLMNKLEQADWGMSEAKEFYCLARIQTALSLMLHDIGIECYVIDDLERAERIHNTTQTPTTEQN